ncbi:MAG: hypothetical protein CMQ46_09200 [Gammaproteobacteria bacterium]|nr:hypothetical protein [Gammaproteobacteria bacterium]MBJ55422.1 hypothetical protein [Gammaproteobacteria bacterium]HBN14297.1 hypothetical protein [Pseudohongiella sp.]|tara:strand:- start:951 stop:1559 length:609 start_codon:yes stop_codon:yes gene_type:complete
MVLSGGTVISKFRPLNSRPLNNRERNILRLALAVALLLVLSNGIPALQSMYQDRSIQIEQLLTDIEREQRLLEETEQWQARAAQTNEQRERLDDMLFESGTAPMLTASIQRLIRQHATQSGINITSTELAETESSGDWIKLEQSLSFVMDNQQSIMNFLRVLEQSRPYLAVQDFSMRRARNQFIGDITVVGFSRQNDTGEAE